MLEQGGQFAGINRKVQLKTLKWSEGSEDGAKRHVVEAQLILKHGGVLTHAGRAQVPLNRLGGSPCGAVPTSTLNPNP